MAKNSMFITNGYEWYKEESVEKRPMKGPVSQSEWFVWIDVRDKVKKGYDK